MTMEEILLKKDYLKVKGMDAQFVEFRHMEHIILFARSERMTFSNTVQQEETKYLYLVYIFKLVDQSKGKNGENTIICFNRIFHTFKEMTENLQSLLSEYILDQDRVLKCLNLAQKLDPDYFQTKE